MTSNGGKLTLGGDKFKRNEKRRKGHSWMNQQYLGRGVGASVGGTGTMGED
jgi:hypothetical protein